MNIKFIVVICIASIVHSVSCKSKAALTNGWTSPQYYQSPSICPENSQCIPGALCSLYNPYGGIHYTQRYGAISCGNEGSDLVCCFTNSNDQRYNTNNNSPARGSVCGTTLVQNDDYVRIGTFPFVVRIGYKDADTGEMKYPCSGSILQERVVLTAAHCALAKFKNFKLYMVRVGEFNSKAQLDCGAEFCALPLQDITISHVVVHPGYRPQVYQDDVALIILNNRINFTITSQPICLPEAWSVIGNYATLVGWGKVAGQTEAYPTQQAIQLPIVNLQQCMNIYGTTLTITENHVCAGGERKRDACSGFGGSPLIEKQGGLYYIVGILSYGTEECGAEGYPSVYTNTKNYVRWIKENIPVLYN